MAFKMSQVFPTLLLEIIKILIRRHGKRCDCASSKLAMTITYSQGRYSLKTAPAGFARQKSKSNCCLSSFGKSVPKLYNSIISATPTKASDGTKLACLSALCVCDFRVSGL